MLKKLTLLAMSVAALPAFAAPAAQATGPLITNGRNAASTQVTSISTNTIIHTNAGTIECTTWDLKISLASNTNTTAKGSGTGTAIGTPTGVRHNVKHTGHCNVSSGAIAEVTSVTLNELHLTKHAGEVTGTEELSFTLHLRPGTGGSLIAECTLGTNGAPVTVKRIGATSSVNVNGKIVRTGGGAFCPAEATITGDYALTD